MMGVDMKRFKPENSEIGTQIDIESENNIPFEIKRIYYIYNVKEGERRGLHAHYKLQQYLICVRGKCTILLDDGKEKKEIILSNPSEGLYIGGGVLERNV